MASTSHGDQPSPERIKARVNGYVGYADVKYRSKSDELLRGHLASQLDRLVDELAKFAAGVDKQGDTALSTSVTKIEKKLRTIGESLLNPVYANSPFLEDLTVPAELLNTIYDHEIVILTEIGNLAEEITDLENSAMTEDELMEWTLRMDDAVDAFNQALFERESLLAGDVGEI